MTDILKIWMKFHLWKMASASVKSSGPVRLGSVEGFCGRKNDVIFSLPNILPSAGYVVFFGGDMQDYKENMIAHRDNKNYAKWDLETTTALLHNHFPNREIVTVKPARMGLKTFSCYENFVESNNFGAPSYENNVNSLLHLKSLLNSVSVKVGELFKPPSSNTDVNISNNKAVTEKPITLIGFSKGCVVLNQFLYSFHSLQENMDEGLDTFVHQISDIYWLDGGHSGISPTWVTDKPILQSFAQLKIEVHVHVTPYQVHCDTRPRIGKEEKIFTKNLWEMGMKVNRYLHFASDPRSLEKHLQILETFMDE